LASLPPLCFNALKTFLKHKQVHISFLEAGLNEQALLQHAFENAIGTPSPALVVNLLSTKEKL